MRLQTSAPAGSTPSWFTPLPWWLALEAELLRERYLTLPFNLDPCAHPEAPVSQAIRRRGGTTFTARDNGLRRPWPARSVAFANPPYDSAAMDVWAPYLAAQASRGHTVVGLVPAWTDRDWWQQAIEPLRRSSEALVRFLPGRMRFGWPGNPWGHRGDTALFPSAVVLWRPRR